MRKALDRHPEIVDVAEEAIRAPGSSRCTRSSGAAPTARA